jgi:hypothetical protein
MGSAIIPYHKKYVLPDQNQVPKVPKISTRLPHYLSDAYFGFCDIRGIF